MMVNESDFAVFLVSADDAVTSRSREYHAPSDNTVFELGLFMSKLERSRLYLPITSFCTSTSNRD